MKKNRIFIALLIAIIAFCFTTSVSAINHEGDIIRNGDVLEKDESNGVVLYFTDYTGNESIAYIHSTENITFGTVPDYVMTSQVNEYLSDPDYSLNWGYNPGPKKFFEYIENYSKYWKIKEIGIENYYTSITYVLTPVTNPETTNEEIATPEINEEPNKDVSNNETIKNPMTKNNLYFVLLVLGIVLVISLAIIKSKKIKEQ